MSIENVAREFVAAINQHDVEKICRLMTEDHTFIDPGGDVLTGADQMKQGWSAYFKMFPDYRIEISDVFVSGETAVLLGMASGTYSTDGILRLENHWEIPAAWKAVVADNKVEVWQVFADNVPILEIVNKTSHN